MADTVEYVLEVRDLCVEFASSQGGLRAVDGLSFAVPAGRTLGIVGESGCGKSVTALSIMRLIVEPGRIVGGEIVFAGQDLLQLSESNMRAVRGNAISMIFQEPMTCLNPVFTCGEQVAEAVRLHQGKNHSDALAVAVEMFELVGIPAPQVRVHNYPHQMSGGMRQRVLIAMALACQPTLLVADEPTTALDVTIQAQILALLAKLQRDRGMGLLLITHDLGVVAETCDEVVVMYAGRVVEQASTADLLQHPRHPYTAGLLASVPSEGTEAKRQRLREIPGMVPPLGARPLGCKFQDRCAGVQEQCRQSEPALVALGNGLVRCHFPLSA